MKRSQLIAFANEFVAHHLQKLEPTLWLAVDLLSIETKLGDDDILLEARKVEITSESLTIGVSASSPAANLISGYLPVCIDFQVKL